MDDFGNYPATSTMPFNVLLTGRYVFVTNGVFGTTSNYSFDWNRPLHYFEPEADTGFRNFDADALLKRHGRSLSPAEKAFIRRFNFQPTVKGIRTCEKLHSEALTRTEKLPGLEARYDRRVPRWRAARWKACT
jgi:hypothetical protein